MSLVIAKLVAHEAAKVLVVLLVLVSLVVVLAVLVLAVLMAALVVAKVPVVLVMALALATGSGTGAYSTVACTCSGTGIRSKLEAPSPFGSNASCLPALTQLAYSSHLVCDEGHEGGNSPAPWRCAAQGQGQGALQSDGAAIGRRIREREVVSS